MTGQQGRLPRLARLTRRVGPPVVGGALAGLSLPPLGAWPLGIAGLGLVAASLVGRRPRSRALNGLLAGVGQFSIALVWSLQFNAAGYVALVAVESCFFALAAVLVPPGQGRIPAFAGALTLAEWTRQRWPFGGLPLGGVALGQVGGPLQYSARIGGDLLVFGSTALAGASLACLLHLAIGYGRRQHATPGRDAPRASGASPEPVAPSAGVLGPAHAGQLAVVHAAAAARAMAAPPAGGAAATPAAVAAGGAARAAPAGRAAAVGLALVVAICLAGALAPDGRSAGPSRLLSAALVQGGGKRGLNQLQVAPSVVLKAAIRETSRLRAHVDLILWPEDVVALDGPLAGSSAEHTLAAIARDHRATLMAGVTVPVGRRRFRNEIVAFSPAGRIVAVFEKVHRVPFGEYVPLRGLFEHLANLSAVPRDAIPGTGTGLMTTPAGRFAVLVSYEVFFARRGRSGVRAGGHVILVPTNTSSYSNDQAPSQEIAASRLQALEEGRYLLQVAPTGYSAVIDNSGNVLERTSLAESALLRAVVPELTGTTWYEEAGDLPLLLASALGVVGGWLYWVLSTGDSSAARRRGSRRAATS